MQLYKSRGFSDFFQDTFTFLKQEGKHFFKHYFIINGAFLLILVVLGYFFTKFYTDFIFGGLLEGKSTTLVDEYINENLGLFVLMALVFIVVALIAGMVSYAYPAIYLKLYSNHEGSHFDTSHLINNYKTNLSKLIIYILCSILIAVPLFIGFVIGAFALVITIIGILAIPLLIGAFMLFYSMTLME